MKVKDIIKAQEEYAKLKEEIEAMGKFKKDFSALNKQDEIHHHFHLYELFCNILVPGDWRRRESRR